MSCGSLLNFRGLIEKQDYNYKRFRNDYLRKKQKYQAKWAQSCNPRPGRLRQEEGECVSVRTVGTHSKTLVCKTQNQQQQQQQQETKEISFSVYAELRSPRVAL